VHLWQKYREVPNHHALKSKHSSTFLEWRSVAWASRALRAVVLWNVWKQVLHLKVWAAAFYMIEDDENLVS
jgi:hypothetical protein